MKRFEQIIKVFLAVVLINLTTNMTAQNTPTEVTQTTSSNHVHDQTKSHARFDSIDVSLLTCGPGDQVWSYYGHTALRIHDKAAGQDIAVNWGMFSFRQSNFVLRFVFGLTDYQMGIVPMNEFIYEYERQGRWIKEQRIVLSPEEKKTLLQAIDKNYLPENRKYRYNFFYDNCTTRARDVIFNAIHKTNLRLPEETIATTYRKEIHKWNESHRWARFGNDLLLGLHSDKAISITEREFLPDNLRQDLDLTLRIDTVNNPIDNHSKKGYIALVDTSIMIVTPVAEVVSQESVTPRMAAIAIAVVVVLLSVTELCKKKNFWWLDILTLLVTGIPGLVLLAMVFSLHPTVQFNCQILILNPLNIVFLWHVYKKIRHGLLPSYYNYWGCLVIAGFLLGLNTQDYAEGMNILACSLLARYILRTITLHRQKKEE